MVTPFGTDIYNIVGTLDNLHIVLNQLIEQYRDGDPKFDGTALGCPLKVFIYLPDEILQAMITIFRKYNYQDKVSAAKDALSEALERRL